MVANPLVSIVDGNYIGIFFWAVPLGFLYMCIKYHFTLYTNSLTMKLDRNIVK